LAFWLQMGPPTGLCCAWWIVRYLAIFVSNTVVGQIVKHHRMNWTSDWETLAGKKPAVAQRREVNKEAETSPGQCLVERCHRASVRGGSPEAPRTRNPQFAEIDSPAGNDDDPEIICSWEQKIKPARSHASTISAPRQLQADKKTIQLHNQSAFGKVPKFP
jgi:hypothetical protein